MPAKPIPALRALRTGALLLLMTAALALPATPQQPSAPLPIATETGGHNDDRHHPEEAASTGEWPRQIQNGIGMEFVLVPAGTFRMGASRLRADPSEKPRHEVTITRPFYIGKYEVTQGQWQAVMGSNPSHFDNCGERCPVDSVTWFDAQAFAGRRCSASKKKRTSSARRFRLQPEAAKAEVAQEAAEQEKRAKQPLTNEEISLAVQSELPEEIILARIEASDCGFDLSIEALAALHEAGVPKSVITAMIGCGQ